MAWELKKVEEQRKQLVELYFEGNLSMKEISAKFGVSRKTGYKWIHRYNESGSDSLKDLSKSPNNPHRIYSNKIIDKAIVLKMRYSKWGPSRDNHGSRKGILYWTGSNW